MMKKGNLVFDLKLIWIVFSGFFGPNVMSLDY